MNSDIERIKLQNSAKEHGLFEGLRVKWFFKLQMVVKLILSFCAIAIVPLVMRNHPIPDTPCTAVSTSTD
jgi:hypothetical protein